MSQKTQKQIIKILPDCQIKSELLHINVITKSDEEHYITGMGGTITWNMQAMDFHFLKSLTLHTRQPYRPFL